jgi:hypothetical protein
MFTSCDDTNEPILLKDSDKFIAFEKTTGEVKENGDKVGILVYIAGVSGTGATVNFDFDIEGIGNPAVEGVDFTLLNTTKTLTFDTYFGYDTIWIDPIDNEEYDKDKRLNIILSNPTNDFKLGANYIANVVISDNEHPLSLVIGNYTINYVSGYDGSAGSMDIETKPNPDDETQIYFLLDTWIAHAGYGGTYTDDDWVVCNIDLGAGTIKISSGQAYPDGTYGPIAIKGYDENGVFEDGELIEGTIDADGTITIPDGMYIPFTSGVNFGYSFDDWSSSVWTKTGAK